MVETSEFAGRILCDAALTLGEGPAYDAATDTAWWLNIVGKELHEWHLGSGVKRVHALPFMGSVLVRIDGTRQLIASDAGLFLRDMTSGALTRYVVLEDGKPGNRSNDGRVHPSGALWIGTMGRSAETGAGAIYHVAGTAVTRLYDKVSIPNSICFSPDGATGYFVDSKVNVIMRVALDPKTGLPAGAPQPFVDAADGSADFDGSVCDAEGHVWNARWGGGAIERYAPDGRLVARHALPARQTTCPAFIGAKLDRLLVTSAWQGMDEATRAADPQAGFTFELGIAVKGVADPLFRL